jgi:hypothetical protein
MSELHFPFIPLPQESLILFKTNFSSSPSPASVIEILKDNRAFYRVLEVSLSEFSDGQNLEKAIKVLGWSNFKERMTSLYVHKVIYGEYPSKTQIQLIEDIKHFENQFRDHSVTGFSRLFLLGFYLKLANMELQYSEEHSTDIILGPEINTILKMSQGRSEKIDWLLLIIYHFNIFLGTEVLLGLLKKSKSFEDIYALLLPKQLTVLANNMLAYGASIQESDFFLYEKI